MNISNTWVFFLQKTPMKNGKIKESEKMDSAKKNLKHPYINGLYYLYE